MFPQGLPGIALLSLRLSIALPLFMQMQQRPVSLPNWLLWSSIGVGTALLAGILTPIAALLAVVAWLSGPLSRAADAGPSGLMVLFTGIALALLGPGAYSFDSYRFGRRVVEVPSHDD